jgi:precorrin-3B synthase
VSPALDACPGVLTLHPARDGLVARIRLPGGYASAARWRALAGLSRDFGDGCVDVTARGNVQLRGLRAADAEALATRTAAAGLMPSAQHDRARNITASPLSGLGGRPPLRALVDALDAALLAGPEFTALPGRFLFALDDGTGGASLAASDVGLSYVAGGPSSGGLASGGPASGDPASGDPASGRFGLIVAGRHVGVRVRQADAVPTVLTVVREALARGVGETVTRIAALPDGGGAVAAAAGGTLAAPAAPDVRLPLGVASPAFEASGTSPRSHTAPTSNAGAEGAGDFHDRDRLYPVFAPKTVAIMDNGAGGQVVVVVVGARLGRLTGEQIEVMAGLVAPGEVVRVGVAGRLVIPIAVSPGEAAEELAAGGLIVAADDPMGDVTACSGAACHRSLADVRAAAGPVSNYHKTHWAGCSRLCGCPPDAEPVVALDATRYRMPGEGGA